MRILYFLLMNIMMLFLNLAYKLDGETTNRIFHNVLRKHDIEYNQTNYLEALEK